MCRLAITACEDQCDAVWYRAFAMSSYNAISRRALLAMAGAGGLSAVLRGAPGGREIPVGLELYSVRQALKQDLMATVDGVAKIGYRCVEFYAPYYSWTPEYAKQVRAELDRLGVKCYSTHNGPVSFTPEGIGKAIELNRILGSRYVMMASAGKVEGIEGWKRVAETLNTADKTLAAEGMHTGYHNHALEWKPIDGVKPYDVLARGTDKSVVMQLDVGTALETGNDPVAWIESHPGRIRSMHLKDWSPEKGYRVLFGDGIAKWKEIFAAAEKTGGVEYYLIEQEGSEYPEMETAEKCFANYKKLRS
jgi:sugar phosphate isomerase/epimerase